MIGNFLVAGALTIPYWGFQKVTNQPKGGSTQRRWRLFSAAFGTFCALDLGFAAIIGQASTNPNKGSIATRAAALPAVFLITGFGTKKVWMRKHFKAFEDPTEPVTLS
ncbi:hypothetical protein KR52_09340 [Synechococcus sp. KORDI-52]|uniref:hypothetical protein n=1 Tax=Synechococcus sp. KORDI-52 TaxID=585425 RepID=UPI0004E0546A|nr:hypothetical protein [Synechococcus sp. KORDI-52]AII49345.1 hypothetical protein KR52_09340 [Synechococcus sp. KORDI-52]